MQIDTDKIRHSKKKLTTFLHSRDFVSFSFFLLIAFVLWVMHSTNMRREIQTKVPIHYVGIPEQVVFDSPMPDHITLTLKDEGMELWQYISHKLDTLTIDMSNMLDTEDRNVEISTDVLLPRIKALMASSTQIMDIEPKLLKADYRLLSQKLVPFELNREPSLNNYYVFSDSITIEPRMATIYGERQAIDTIDKIVITVPQEIIETTGRYSFPIETPDLDCRVEPSNPTTFISVEMSSEKRLTIPITVKNMPKDMTFIAFPSTVELVFSLGVSQFASVDEEDFKIELDYNDLKTNVTEKANIQVVHELYNIYNLKTNTTEVEFILEHK